MANSSSGGGSRGRSLLPQHGCGTCCFPTHVTLVTEATRLSAPPPEELERHPTQRCHFITSDKTVPIVWCHPNSHQGQRFARLPDPLARAASKARNAGSAVGHTGTAVHLHRSAPKTPQNHVTFPSIPRSTFLKTITSANYIHVINISMGTFPANTCRIPIQNTKHKGFSGSLHSWGNSPQSRECRAANSTWPVATPVDCTRIMASTSISLASWMNSAFLVQYSKCVSRRGTLPMPGPAQTLSVTAHGGFCTLFIG